MLVFTSGREAPVGLIVGALTSLDIYNKIHHVAYRTYAQAKKGRPPRLVGEVAHELQGGFVSS